MVVDQLSQKQLEALLPRLPEGGFRWLVDNGSHYKNAHFQHAATVTATGHAALITGVPASEHGIVGNQWLEAQDGSAVRTERYCVEDKRYPQLLGQALGRAPTTLLSDTLGDSMIKHDARSKVIALAGKDRSAILMGGKLGKAYWYDKQAAGMNSSRYYHSDGQQLPDWLSATQALFAEQLPEQWQLSQDEARYQFKDDRPEEGSPLGSGYRFPHALPVDKPANYFANLRYTPFADKLLAELAVAAIKHEKLGADESPDLLAIGFSATDYIGHVFGPDSRESEDNLFQLDRSIAALITSLKEQVGLENTLLILTADHGVTSARLSPSAMDSDYLDPRAMIGKLNRRAANEFGITPLIIDVIFPGLVLNQQAIGTANKDPRKVADTLADWIEQEPGYKRAWSRQALTVLASKYIDSHDALTQQVLRSFHPDRSVDVVIVREADWFQKQPRQGGGHHGSPWAADTHVPLILARKDLAKQTLNQTVGPETITVTVLASLNADTNSVVTLPESKK